MTTSAFFVFGKGSLELSTVVVDMEILNAQESERGNLSSPIPKQADPAITQNIAIPNPNNIPLITAQIVSKVVSLVEKALAAAPNPKENKERTKEEDVQVPCSTGRKEVRHYYPLTRANHITRLAPSPLHHPPKQAYLFTDIQTLKQAKAKSGDHVRADPSDPVTRLCCAIIHDLCDGNALAVDIIDKLIASNLHTTLITTIAKTGAQMKTLIDAGVVDVLVDDLDAKDPNAADTACVTLSAFVALSGEDPAIFREKKRDDKVYKMLVKHQQAFEKTWFSSQLHQYQEYVFMKSKNDMCALHSAVCLAMMYKGSELPLTSQAILLYLYPVALSIPHSLHGGNSRYALAVLAEGKGEENLKKSIVSSTYAAVV
ncbi:hypothetical protein BLNAU_19488 [Blattamonas nauphoetae]|uniref:Uncharacterized protein n=1 Tax=Blattamonas nauphoetae TaxID=2049346 RepID=A0ABQ9X3R1_9EUKA|nr:hypothetical protein BLNAU_19488 [Blattamonas nauphoetae]